MKLKLTGNKQCMYYAGWLSQEHRYTLVPPHDKTNKMICAPSEDADQPGHPPRVIRAFAVCSKDSQGSKVSSCGQWRLIKLGGCPGWSESSLGAHAILLVLLWDGSLHAIENAECHSSATVTTWIFQCPPSLLHRFLYVWPCKLLCYSVFAMVCNVYHVPAYHW